MAILCVLRTRGVDFIALRGEVVVTVPGVIVIGVRRVPGFRVELSR
jgi:hypothetical protein